MSACGFMRQRSLVSFILICLFVSAAAAGRDGDSLSCARPHVALRTNVIYNALLVPNLGVDFCLGKGWTLGGSGMYAWWSNDARHRYRRVCGIEATVRKYFGTPRGGNVLTGHHLGIYGQLLTYDLEYGDKGYMGGRPGGRPWEDPSYGGGLEYGYSLPAGRRMNIDFSIGVGYLGGTYHVYRPIDGHYVWQETRMRHWFGPTRAELSLVWLLGGGSAAKGGRR